MLTLDLFVPVGRDHEALRLVDAPAEHAQGVQGRLVRPVDVLEDDDLVVKGSSPRSARATARGSAPAASRSASAPSVWAAMSANGPSGVGVARFSHDPRRTRQPGLRAERPHERRLPDPGLAADEDEPSPLHGGRCEGGQQLVPLEKRRHRLMFCPSYAGSRPDWLKRARQAYDRWMAVAAAPRTELVERGEPRATLHEAFSEARERRGGLVFVSGEAGVGKTALLRRFADELGEAAPVLWGACDPLLTPPPLGPILEIAAEAPSAIAEAIDAGGAHAIAAALLGAGHDWRPLVLVLEDVHWADEATLDVVRVLGRRVGGTPTLVLATYRDDELDRFDPLRRPRRARDHRGASAAWRSRLCRPRVSRSWRRTTAPTQARPTG